MNITIRNGHGLEVSSITNDVCQITKQSVDTLVLKPHSAHTGIELSEESLRKLLATYTALLLEEKQKQKPDNTRPYYSNEWIKED